MNEREFELDDAGNDSEEAVGIVWNETEDTSARGWHGYCSCVVFNDGNESDNFGPFDTEVEAMQAAQEFFNDWLYANKYSD